METKQETVQEVKAEQVETAEGPLVVRLKSERVQDPETALRAKETTLYELEVNERKKRLVIDIWELQVQVTIEEPEAGPVRAA